MQEINFPNTKLFSNEDLRASSLPSKEEYIALESHEQLISPRSLWVSVFFRLIMITVLSIGVPPYLVLIWAAISFSANYWLIQLIETYRQLSANNPRLMSDPMKLAAKQFNYAYWINCVVWASASVLAQFWLTELPRVLAHTTLTAILYFFLMRNCSNAKVMHRTTFIILGLPLSAAASNFFLNVNNPQEFYSFLGFSFYIILNFYLVWIVGRYFNIMFLKRCESEYANKKLIDSLEQSQQKLSVEQAALIDANAVIQQFYSAAAHDLRQPVYAMEIYTDMLCDDPSKLQTLLPKISQSCMSINAMFNELFDFQQKHTGDTQVVVAKLNIADTLKSLALHFEPIAASKGLVISFKTIDGNVETIPLYLVRILSNLIANAITYTPTGRILVAARKAGEHLSFEIWDTGPGIDKAAQGKIFDEFYRVNTEKKTSNLGLGLAIVKELVRRLDGSKIRVSSVMGRGTVFKLLLPIETFSELTLTESTMHYDL